MHDYAMFTVCTQQGVEYVFVMKNLVNIILSLFAVNRKNILYNLHGKNILYNLHGIYNPNNLTYYNYSLQFSVYIILIN